MEDIITGLRPIEAGIDDVEEKLIKEKDKKPEYSKQFYCHGCHRWIPCKNDFEPYDCPCCAKSRWGD